MKKFFVWVITCLLILSLSGCGISILADRDIGRSEVYSKAEISAAMDEVCKYFARNIEGCILLELSYNENSVPAAEEWAKDYDAEKAIVLYSKFIVLTEGNGSLQKGEVYDKWSWILTKNPGQGWKVKNYGFA